MVNHTRYIGVAVSVVVVSGLALGMYFYLPALLDNGDKGGVADQARRVPDGWREYKNERYIFSILYPEQMAVEEFEEGTGARTFVFENREENLGFQIFVVPYGEEKISDERFLLDVPLGVREGASNFYLDGVLATSFYSKSLGLGDTWEAWFVHKGFLYEVTTLREQEVWLYEIMKTWLFI